MKLHIKYNKTALREFQKKLQIRERALPTLKNKEAAFRAMVIEAKKDLAISKELYATILTTISPWKALWQEFDHSLATIKKVHSTQLKIAGVRIPEFEKIDIEVADFNSFSHPSWFTDGVRITEELLETSVRLKFMENKLRLLEHARKKATQKVNLYEKVQIPALTEAIKQIKRYLEDEENLAKAGQKLLKVKLEKAQQT
jgi:V/A-type H+-transporting ATPase subunit D